MDGHFPGVCSIPTGLGKTSAIAVWLLALADRAHAERLDRFPRRLVYVVNRRTVVDQATRDVEFWRKRVNETPGLEIVRTTFHRLAVRPGEDALSISTLRGQLADNAEWRTDPARPAVVIGTVDMIGSRLLFGGYGCGFRSRPLHAAFLGQDTWLVHDEAHLEPAFQQLLIGIQREQGIAADVRPFRVTALTATSRDGDVDFTLGDEDRRHHVVHNRLCARKALALHRVDTKSLVDTVVARVLDHRDSQQAIVVFLRTVEDVDNVVDRLRKAGLTIEQLTGTLRGLERDRLVAENPVFARFAIGSGGESAPGTVCLVCTSAGEVGVNMSGDHMVCDLTPFDSMAQRLGRVNRLGDGDARVDVIVAGIPGVPDEEDDRSVSESAYEISRARTARILSSLPAVENTGVGVRHDASPAALEMLPLEERRRAFSPNPVTLPASEFLFDAWALTSVRDRLPGRPPLERWLHGVAPWESPQTTVAWRHEVDVVTGPLLDTYAANDLLDEYPLKPHEVLRDRSDRVFTHLKEMATRLPDARAWVVAEDDMVGVRTLGELAAAGRSAIERCTLVLPPSAGGLALDRNSRPTGRLSGRTPASEASPEAAYDVADLWLDKQGTPRRKRVWEDDTPPAGMRLVRAIRVETPSEGGSDEPEVRVWRWFVRPADADDEGSRTALRSQLLDEHQALAEKFASILVDRLGLDKAEATAIRVAARLHDTGKARALWQRSIRNTGYPGIVLAKSGDRFPLRGLSSYRHELGSLIDIRQTSDVRALPSDVQDLVLHLIAAHHGRARPAFPANEIHDPERADDEAADAACEVMARYGRLQRRYGRWGLAFLESLVRVADALASNPEPAPVMTDGGSAQQYVRQLFTTLASASRAVAPTFYVNVDPLNPGEFLACCGLLELAERLSPGVEGWFEDGVFYIRGEVGLLEVVRALVREPASEITRLASGLEVKPLIAPLIVHLTDGPRGTLVLDAWMTVRIGKGEVVAAANPPWNFWSGQQTSLRIWRALRDALLQQMSNAGDLAGERLFAHRVPLSGRFGFDPGAAWTALDVGFSPNEQSIAVASSPAVELLAAVGFQRFRPVVAEDRETFRYATWTTPLPPTVAAAACTGLLPSGGHRFRGIVMSRGSYAALGTSIPLKGHRDE